MLCVVKSKRKDRHAEALTQDYIITRKFPFIAYLEAHPMKSKPVDIRFVTFASSCDEQSSFNIIWLLSCNGLGGSARAVLSRAH